VCVHMAAAWGHGTALQPLRWPRMRRHCRVT
jgi:hypothetical protein